MKKITLKSAGKDIGNAASAGAGVVLGSIALKKAAEMLPTTLPPVAKGLVVILLGLGANAFVTDPMLKSGSLGIIAAGVLNVTKTVGGEKLAVIPALNGTAALPYRMPIAQNRLLNGMGNTTIAPQGFRLSN